MNSNQRRKENSRIGIGQIQPLGSDAGRSWINSALGEEIPFVFGAPFFEDGYPLFPYNFTLMDIMISQAVITYWSNFAKSG